VKKKKDKDDSVVDLTFSDSDCAWSGLFCAMHIWIYSFQ
jgi:hypothetical protein